MSFAILLTLFLIVKSSIADEDWSYDNPDDWKTKYPDCGGENQSPINIVVNDTIQLGFLDLNWKNYDQQPKSVKAVNIGRSVQIDIEWNDGDEVPSITSSLFDGEYVFAQYNFHWGANDDSGSEHTFNGKSFQIEGHMIHYKKDYGSFDEAIKKENGLVVFAAVGSISEGVSNPNKKTLRKITPFIDDIKEVGGTVAIEDFQLSDFQVVNSKSDFVAYNGSLAFPKCSEVVTWIISMTKYKTPKEELEMLRKVRLTKGDHNNRPTQPINGRKVYLFSTLNDPPKKKDNQKEENLEEPDPDKEK